MPRALRPLLLLGACALLVGGCGSATSTAGFTGAEHDAAQAIANLQSAANAGEGDKICAQYLAHARVRELGGKKGCETAIKHQLAQVDNLEVTIKSVKVAPDGRSATAQVRSVFYGKQ